MNALTAQRKPLVYSCSGCSSVAQMANYLAVQLDRSGHAEMSCIAGVGGNVKKLVHIAKSGRNLIAIDGCPLACVKACLDMQGLKPDVHIKLDNFGVSKKYGEDFDGKLAEKILNDLQTTISEKYRSVSPITQV